MEGRIFTLSLSPPSPPIRGLLNDKENAAARLWRDLHTCVRDSDRTMMLVIRKSDAGIGRSVIARCVECNHEHNITDYDCW